MGEELTSDGIHIVRADRFSPDKSKSNSEEASDDQRQQIIDYLRDMGNRPAFSREDIPHPEISGDNRVWEKIKEGNDLSTVRLTRDPEGKVIQVHAKVAGSTDDLYFRDQSLEALRKFSKEEVDTNKAEK